MIIELGVVHVADATANVLGVVAWGALGVGCRHKEKSRVGTRQLGIEESIRWHTHSNTQSITTYTRKDWSGVVMPAQLLCRYTLVSSVCVM